MKQWTRRQLLQRGAALSAGLVAARAWGKTSGMSMAHPPRAKTLDALKLASFVDPLPLPVLQAPIGRRSSTALGAVDASYYAVHVREIHARLHRDLPPSSLFGYGPTSAPVLFEAQSNEGILIDWINNLPPRHFLPTSTPHPGMENAPPTRISTHMHGARVPAISDGYPEAWYGPGKRRLCYYPNHQEATALWCHDHAMGVSLFNVFAGLMCWYLLRDPLEQSLHLPSGKYELPLLIYDRSF
ncbi:MAG: bilirubin oxidase, partial [Acidobacteriaceae bacterium]